MQKLLEKYHIIFVLLLYFVITLVFTYPVILKFNSEIPKWGSDTYQVVGNIQASANILKSAGPWHGITSLIKTFNVNIFTPYAVLNLFFNKFTAYNILFFFSFVMSGLGMYLLALHVTKNKLAAFIAGIIFAFSPFHIHQSLSTNVGTMHQEWLPFFALFMIRFFEGFKLKFFVLTLFFALCIAVTEHQFLAFTTLFAGVVIVYQFITRRELIRNKKLWAYLASSFAFLIILLLTIFRSLFTVATSGDNYLNAGIGQAKRYSMHFFDPVAPPLFNPLWPKLNGVIQSILHTGLSKTDSYFIGFSVLALLIYLVVILLSRAKKEAISQTDRKNIMFWLIAFGIFYIFSLGPVKDIGTHQLYLPYYPIYKFVPFFENIRTTGRIFVIAMMAISVLAALGIDPILKKIKKDKILFVAAFSLVVLLEFSAWPISTVNMAYSSFYDNIAKDKEPYKLLEIPGSTSYDYASFEIFTNTIHTKKVVN